MKDVYKFQIDRLGRGRLEVRWTPGAAPRLVGIERTKRDGSEGDGALFGVVSVRIAWHVLIRLKLAALLIWLAGRALNSRTQFDDEPGERGAGAG